jgi:hypothetical protein
MQENSKNIIETIAEDIRINGIDWVANWIIDSCNFNTNLGLYKTWNKLCTWISSYYLAIKDISGNYIMVDNADLQIKCWDINNECVLVKKQWSDITKLSNSRVRFTNLEFLVSDKYIPKVTIVYEMKPSIKKWVKYETIKNTKLNLQTTLSTRLIKTN